MFSLFFFFFRIPTSSENTCELAISKLSFPMKSSPSSGIPFVLHYSILSNWCSINTSIPMNERSTVESLFPSVKYLICFAIYITFTNVLIFDGTESHSMGGVLLSFCFPSLFPCRITRPSCCVCVSCDLWSIFFSPL